MKVGRNDPCPCGSGKKYKHCCYAKDSVKHEEPLLEGEPSKPVSEESGAEEQHPAAAVEPKHEHAHEHGRGRFHGKTRGGSGSFSPRVFRGSQRGN